MTTKTKAPSRSAAPAAGGALPAGPWLTPPWTMEERLRRIEAMGENIGGFVRFMCQVDRLEGTSSEAKERAVTAFYDRMVIVASQLGHILETLRLE